MATGVAVAEQVSTAQPVDEGPVDAEILSDNLTRGANLGAGFAKWSPDSGETIRDRLGAIVGGAMGYEPEDLPWEVPLIELGLDSLMAVRIKNRVEYDFDLPPIQLTAVRDANLYNVESLIQYAIDHRDEVYDLAEHQKTQTPEEIAAEQAAIMSGASTVGRARTEAEPKVGARTGFRRAGPAAADRSVRSKGRRSGFGSLDGRTSADAGGRRRGARL